MLGFHASSGVPAVDYKIVAEMMVAWCVSQTESSQRQYLHPMEKQ